MTTSSDFHWLAGLLEGEGSFIPGPPTRPNQPRVALVTTDKDVAERAAALMGVSVHPRRCRTSPAHYKPQFQCALQGGRAVLLMRALQPYMSARRQQAIQRALDSFTVRDSRTITDPARVPVLAMM